MELKDVVGHAATICTIAVFLSGIEICRKIYKKKSTIDISPFPFFGGLLSCSFWMRYGLLIDDSPLIIVNLSGTILQMLYICWYSRYNVLKNFHLQFLILLLIVALFYTLTTFCIPHENARIVTGISSSIAGVLFMASPLASLAQVLKTKNVDSLPFPLILSTFVMATLWVFYGILTEDPFVQVPNFLGACLSFSQLCVYGLYCNRKKYEISIKI